MKTNFLFYCGLLGLLMILFQCKKDDTPTKQPEVGPLFSFFDEPGIFVDTTESSGSCLPLKTKPGWRLV